MKSIVPFVFILLMNSNVFAWPGEDMKTLPTIEVKTHGMQKYEGFIDFYWDEIEGKVWLEIDKWDEEFLYINSLPAGVGSNDIGLDRGQLGYRRVVKFYRVGPKVLLQQPNYDYRAISENDAERRAVAEAFAQSILWGFEIAAETGDRVLVSANDFYLRDAHDVSGTLSRTKQGAYKLDASRCAFYLTRTKNFPQNTELEVTLTFTGDASGSYVRQVVPTADIVTVRQHYSFVRLLDDNYRPRVSDPRAGYWEIGFMDYAMPISEPLHKSYIARHRLQKKDPAAAMSEPVEPIVYFVDPGAPEPIRSALVDGALWWNQAFAAIGYKNAFQVQLLPEDADPMDVRYNVIQWVHRATRGWSYGDGVADPRTGEIIKGHVTLGSLRVRQDFLIAQGLLAPFEQGKPVSPAMQEMALARLRQLAAHEVGHTLGLIHNFAASASDRASVMDYPHPYIQLGEDGTLDFSEAYGSGIGAWDKAAIAYGYSDFPVGVNKAEALQKIIRQTIADGLILISDSDARPAGGAHPLAHLWDNGIDAADDLYRVMRVRRHALSRFSENSIPMAQPMSTLEEVFVPLYLSHRYQVDATSKLLGGLYYTYAMRGDGQKVTEIVNSEQQRKALSALLFTLKPGELAIPERILQMIPPRAFGTVRSRENFQTRTNVTFDPLAAAEVAADQTLRFLLQPERAARLVEYHARNKRNPGLVEVLDKILTATWFSQYGTGYHAEVRRVVNNIVLNRIMDLAADTDAATQVRAIAYLKLDEVRTWLSKKVKKEKDILWRAHLGFAMRQIDLYFQDPSARRVTKPVSPPAGSPIGTGSGCMGHEFF